MIKEKKILLTFCLYILTGLLICVVGISNVFAYSYEDIGYFNSSSQVQVEVSYNASPLSMSINTEYYLESVYSLDINIVNLNLSQDYVYWFEIYLPQTNSINANYAEVIWFGNNNTTGTCSIITTYFANNYPHVTFKCNGTTNIRELAIRYYNTNNSYIINSNYFKWSYTFMRKRVPDSDDNSAIITDSINSNTQSIINNNNSNTQSIIDNQNSNTQKEIDSQKVCDNYNTVFTRNSNDISIGFLRDDGTIGGNSSTSTWRYTTDYILVNKNKLYNISGSGILSSNASYCLYDKNKEIVDCNSYTSNNIDLTPQQDGYLRFSFESSGSAILTGEYCQNGNQALNETNKGILGKLKEFFNFFNNDDIDSDTTSDTFDDLNSSLPTNSVISDLLLLPVRLLQAIVNSLNGTCSSFNLGSLYGTNLVMPCIDLQSYLGNTIWTFIDLVFSGMFILVIRKKFIQIWENITNLRNGGNEVD